MSKQKIIIICGLIFLATFGLLFLIYNTEPEAQSEGATKKTAILVSVTPVEEGTYSPVFEATGTVTAYEDVELNALVSGEIIRRNPNFIPGGTVKKGTELIKINPADYLNDLELAKSDLLQARSDLEVEQGRQYIAKQDLVLLGKDSLTDEQKNLVLRKPQYRAILARIKAAEAAVEQAKLNLSRTSVKAPFDAQIITQNVSLGSQVDQGISIGRLVGIGTYWVEVNLPVKKLAWLQFPSENEAGAPVKLYNTTDWPEGQSRTGYLVNRVGALDRQSRLARVLIKIPDPLAMNKDQPALMIGSFIDAGITGKPIEGVVRVKRDYLRKNNTAWVMNEGKLSIRKLKIHLMDAEYAYVTEGLKDGDQVVTSSISAVTEGIPLRTAQDSTREN